MALDRAKEHLEKYGMEDRIQLFDVSSATVELAAKALGCKPERIAKTLSFNVNDKAVLIVAAGDAKINNSKYKAFYLARQQCFRLTRLKQKSATVWEECAHSE